MPRLAYLGGVVIRVYFNDTRAHHESHFHAVTPDRQVLVSIRNLEILAGSLAAAEWRKVKRWAARNRALLEETWNACNPHQPLEE